MIEIHQPTIFGNDVIAAVSSMADGNMKHGLQDAPDVIAGNRQRFLKQLEVDMIDTTLVPMVYTDKSFTKYRIVTEDDKGKGMNGLVDIEPADGLVVTSSDHALFLPLADCIGAILYDPEHRILMVSHLGRHNLTQAGATKSVAYLESNFHTDPSQLKVWLSPAVGKASYPLHAFEGKSLHEVAQMQLAKSGVLKSNIENASVDTATSKDYYSHSQYLQDNGMPGRFAIVASMRTQGEPAA